MSSLYSPYRHKTLIGKAPGVQTAAENVPQVLLACGETLPEGLLESLGEALATLDPPVGLVLGEPVPFTDTPAGVAAALATWERQGERLDPAAAIVHGTGDGPLAAAISLVKLGIPVARLEDPGASANDLPGLLADRTLTLGESLQEQIADWLPRILSA